MKHLYYSETGLGIKPIKAQSPQIMGQSMMQVMGEQLQKLNRLIKNYKTK